MNKRIVASLALLPLCSFLVGAQDDCSGQSVQQQALHQQAGLQAEHEAQFNARCEASRLISQEVRNLCDRAKRINVQNMQSCVTLFAKNGAVVGFFPVKGKISSLNSYLLSDTKVIDGGQTNQGGSATAHDDPVVVENPDIDGAYGKNADGIFFFTSDTNAYVEWQGDYFWSDLCLTPSTQPLLVRQIAGK